MLPKSTVELNVNTLSQPPPRQCECDSTHESINELLQDLSPGTILAWQDSVWGRCRSFTVVATYESDDPERAMMYPDSGHQMLLLEHGTGKMLEIDPVAVFVREHYRSCWSVIK